MPIKRFIIPVTKRDLEVLDLRADGLTFEEIGKKLFNKKTGKTGVSTSAARIAYQTALMRTVYEEEKRHKEEAQQYAEEYCKAVCKIIINTLAD